MKRILALLLALAMLFTAVACGTQGGQSDATPTPDAEPTKEEIDLTEGGKWMNYKGANGDMNLRLPAYEFKSNTIRILNHYEVAQPDAGHFNALRDVYGLQYESVVVDNNDKQRKLVSMVMGGDAPDVMWGSFMPALVTKGYIDAWNNYIDFSIGLWTGLESSLKNFAMNGNYYFIESKGARHDNIIWVNKDIFEELGAKTPMEYYEEGNWTWETLRECALATTLDEDSDGTAEIYGLAIDEPQAFVFTTGVDFVTYNSDGTATNNILSSNVSRAVNFFVSLYADGVVNEESDSRETFAAGKIAMYLGPLWYRASFTDMIFSDRVTVVPWPRDAQADKYYVKEEFGNIILSKDAPNPQGAAAYMCAKRYDVLNTDEAIYYDDETRKENLWESNAIADLIEEYMFQEDRYPVSITWAAFEVHEFWGDIWFFTRLGEPWSSTAERLAPLVDEKIDKILEG